MVALHALLRDAQVRLVSLTGPGGVGKTRLALQVAAELSDGFGDGVFFLSLAPLREPALVAAAITQTLGVREAGRRSPCARLTEYLHEREVLLALDNFEQLLEAAPLLAELLAAAPRLKLLVTSRAVLRLRGEHELPVPPLAVPAVQAFRRSGVQVPSRSREGADSRGPLPPGCGSDRRFQTPERMIQYSSIALFIERAQAARPGFIVTSENAPVVAEICHRLDGLPLAIELAAARIKLLSPAALLVRLTSRLQLLVGGPRDLPARQQTLRDTIAWSYDLLTDAEKALFRRLSVFAGGCTLEAVEAVCSDLIEESGELPLPSDQQPVCSATSTTPGERWLEAVAGLVNQSLLQRDEEPEGEPRFRMLETIREYSQECLSATGEAKITHERHAGYFLQLAEQTEPELNGPRQAELLARLEREHDNIQAALAWYHARGAIEVGLRLATALTFFWDWRAHNREGREHLQSLLDRADAGLPLRLRARTLSALGHLAARARDEAVSQRFQEEAIALWRQLGEPRAILDDLWRRHHLAVMRGDLVTSVRLHRERLSILEQMDDPPRLCEARNQLGLGLAFFGEYEESRALLEQALVQSREIGHAHMTAIVMSSLGTLSFLEGKLDDADRWLHDGLVLSRDGIWELEFMAAAAAARGNFIRAVRLYGAVAAAQTSLGSGPDRPHRRIPHERSLTAARAALGEAAFAAVWAEGQALTLEEACAEALGSGNAPPIADQQPEEA
jgi:predicted ATPase